MRIAGTEYVLRFKGWLFNGVHVQCGTPYN